MPFYTRTDEAGTVIWSSYGERPADLVAGEVECTEEQYRAGHAQVWTSKPPADTQPSAASTEGRDADKPA